jgi:hypothetical protein
MHMRLGERVFWGLGHYALRLDRPGVARRALDLFDALPPDAHHRVSQEFLGLAPGTYRQSVLDITDDGRST